MKQLVNLTQHPIVIRTEDGDIKIEPTGLARVSQIKQEPVGNINDIPLFPAPVYDTVEGLPRPKTGKVYIVSGIVLAHCAGRDDVVAPGTGPLDNAIRNEKGHIVAVTCLVAAPTE